MTYMNENEVKYIGFDARIELFKAGKIVDEFRRSNNHMKVNIEL